MWQLQKPLPIKSNFGPGSQNSVALQTLKGHGIKWYGLWRGILQSRTTLLWSTPEWSRVITVRYKLYIRHCKPGTLRLRTPTLQSTPECSAPYPGFADAVYFYISSVSFDSISLIFCRCILSTCINKMLEPEFLLNYSNLRNSPQERFCSRFGWDVMKM